MPLCKRQGCATIIGSVVRNINWSNGRNFFRIKKTEAIASVFFIKTFFLSPFSENTGAFSSQIIGRIAKGLEINSDGDATKPIPIVGFTIAALEFIIGIIAVKSFQLIGAERKVCSCLS